MHMDLYIYINKNKDIDGDMDIDTDCRHSHRIDTTDMHIIAAAFMHIFKYLQKYIGMPAS